MRQKITHRHCWLIHMFGLVMWGHIFSMQMKKCLITRYLIPRKLRHPYWYDRSSMLPFRYVHKLVTSLSSSSCVFYRAKLHSSLDMWVKWEILELDQTLIGMWNSHPIHTNILQLFYHQFYQSRPKAK